MTLSVFADDWKPLWADGPAPGAPQPPKGTEQYVKDRYRMVEVPQYDLYLPAKEKATGQGVVLFPGGGYFLVSTINEGQPVAKLLSEKGIAVMVVKYRVDGSGKKLGYKYPVPLLDARRAIRTMRHRAKEWNVDPKQIGVMGFSAGGHLAAMATTMYKETFKAETKDAIDQVDCRPDFSILIYPVIEMKESFRHKGSAQLLTGGDLELLEWCSVQHRVNAETPPCFLAHAADDRGVPLENSLQFVSACAKHKVPVNLHVFSQGGHGFGLKGSGDSKAWPELLMKWLGQQQK